MQEDVTEVIKRLVSDKTGMPVNQITNDITLAELDIDSMAILDLVFDLEHEFDISFPENLVGIKTLDDLAKLTLSIITTKKAS